MMADVIQSLFAGPAGRSSLAAPAHWLVDWAHGGEASSSGIRVTRKAAMTLSAVWRAVQLIAGDVGRVPMLLHRRQGTGRIEAADHPAYTLLKNRCGPGLMASTLRETLTAHALLEGNGYAAIVRRGGKPREMIPLLPEQTEPKMDRGGRLYYETRVEGKAIAMHPEDVLHIKNLSHDGIVGLSVLRCARESLGGAIATQQYAGKFFSNGAQPSVVIEVPELLDDEAVARMRQQWQERHSGLTNAHRPAVLEQGAKLSAFGMKNSDAQFLETRQYQVRDIANWFGVPSHKIGDTSKTSYASIEQENLAYLHDCLSRWLAAWSSECWLKLLSTAEQDSDAMLWAFDTDELRSADVKAETEATVKRLEHGIYTLDEARKYLNLPAAAGGVGGNHYFPSNHGTLTAEGIQAPKAASKPQADPEKEDQPAPSGDEKPEDEAARYLALSTARRIRRRLEVAAEVAAKHPGEFLARLEQLPAAHAEPLAEMLVPVVMLEKRLGRTEAEIEALVRARKILEALTQALTAASEVRARELPQSVAAAIETLAANGWPM
ncbi:MAG: phage portal protein [Planctomycetota bacterium]